MFKTVFIGLGANIGDREANIYEALSQLNANDGIEIVKSSTLIETKAVSVIKQPDFLNGVVEIRTILTPVELFEMTKDIEKKMGRTAKGTREPRQIDLDILLYGQDIVCEQDLTIPHPLMHERDFVLIPFNEIAPQVVHPVLGEPISTLYQQVVWGVYGQRRS
jgi:2-amino-4-hydroxy-6-hydroxymethyldihydropteridine diphosphokinase